MRLSENLNLAECLKSQTAARLGIDNTPDKQHIDNLKLIARDVFQPLRDHLGVPVFVSSGYRCKALNDAIGGSTTSQHRTGQALDLDVQGINDEIFYYIKENLDFDQLIWEFGDSKEPGWVHVSYIGPGKGKNRGQVLKAFSKNGRTAYAVW